MKNIIYTLLLCFFYFSDAQATPSKKEVRETEKKLLNILNKALWTQSNDEDLNHFLTAFRKHKWQEAFYIWDSSFNKSSSFLRSETGQALYAYLLFKNNIKIMGLETLFTIRNPMKILNELRVLLRSALPHNHKVWHFVEVKWSSQWTKVLGTQTQKTFALSQALSFKDAINIQEALENLPEASISHKLRWYATLMFAVRGNSQRAIKQLQILMKLKKPPVSRQLMYLTAGRIFIQLGNLDQALSYYERISKRSDYWLLAHEEMAWISMLKNDPQRALGYTHTLMYPVLANQVGPEPSYLHALASVKVCDYWEALETLRKFKIQFAPRIKSLQFLAKHGHTKSSRHLRQRFLLKGKKMPLSIFHLGWRAKNLPTLAHRDQKLFHFTRTQYFLIKEAKVIHDLSKELNAKAKDKNLAKLSRYKRSYSQKILAGLKQKIDQKIKKYNKQFYRRLQKLASKDLVNIHNVIKKLHVVEAEVLQLMTNRTPATADQMNIRRQNKITLSAENIYKHDSSYSRIFTDKERELWFDELGSYRVHVNVADCEDGKIIPIPNIKETTETAI